MHVGRGGLALWVAAIAACGAQDTSTAGRAAAAATRDSAARADSAKAEEAAKTLKVTNVMIGKRIDPGSRVTEPTFQFEPTDTVYISIGTVGSPDTAAFAAHWSNQRGKVVDSTAKTVKPKGRDNVELHSSPPKGWAPGVYRVTIYANGDSVDSKTFAVRKPQ